MSGALSGNFVMHAPQLDVYMLAREYGSKTVLGIAGIRGGKTHEMMLEVIFDAIMMPTREDQCHAVVSPTFGMSKIGPQRKFRALCADKSLFPVNPIVRWNKSENTYWIKNCKGELSRVQFFSGEDPDRFRGDEWLSVRYDEGAYLKEEAFLVGQGRVASTNGKSQIASSPNGYNFVWEQAERCTQFLRRKERDGYTVKRSPDGKVLFVQWGSLLNPLMPDSDGFAELAENYDPETYEQEVGGEFIGKTGRVYKAFNRKTLVRELSAPISMFGTVYIGQDFNVARMCSAMMVELPPSKNKKGSLHQFDEMEKRDTNTHELSKNLGLWCLKNNIPKEKVVIIPDASGAKRQTAASDTAASDIAILRRDGWRIDALRSNPRVKDRVNCWNGLMHHGRFTISPKCKLTIEAIEKQPWGEDGEPEKDGILDNRNDASGYVAWKRFPLKRKSTIGDRKQVA